MHDNHAELPEIGEQLTFESGDVENLHERVTMRVGGVSPGMHGTVILEGWRIGAYGFPVETLQLEVSIATVEARRLHRRCRT